MAPDYDIVHAHQTHYPAAAAARGLAGERTPLICKAASSGHHFDLDTLAQTMPWKTGPCMARYLADHASHFIAVTPLALEDMARWGIKEERVSQIPNGIELPEPNTPEARQAARAALGIPDSAKLIIATAGLREVKNLPTLIESIGFLTAEGPEVRLVILGEGPMRAALTEQRDALGLGESVALPGLVDNVPSYLQAADAFALSSHAEGLSNALLEAMSRALPCVASDIPANRHLIVHGESGLLAETTSPQAFAKSLARILRDSEGAQSLGRGAREVIQSGFDLERVADRIEALYGRLCKSKGDEGSGVPPY
jgi:glycosyltransferase involved in cell wall biosynthesis